MRSEAQSVFDWLMFIAVQFAFCLLKLLDVQVHTASVNGANIYVTFYDDCCLFGYLFMCATFLKTLSFFVYGT